MKFLEELSCGEAFKLNDKYFLLTIDFKENKTTQFKYSISIDNGSGQWIKSNELVEPVPLFTIDSAGTIIPIKETKKTNETNN